MSWLSRKIGQNKGWLAPAASVMAPGIGGAAMGGGMGAAGSLGGGAGGSALGNLNPGQLGLPGGGIGADFSGADLLQQQDRNVGLLNASYQQALRDIMAVQGTQQSQYAGLASQYGQQLQAGIGQSGLNNLYGANYQQGLQDLALRQGDVGSLAAARMASQAGKGRGGMAFGGGASEQLRRAQGEASLGTQGALLGANAQTEQGRSQVANTIAQLLAGGAQNQMQAQLAGLSAQQQLALGQIGSIGGLGGSLMGGIAKVSPEDTNKSFENSLKIWEMLNRSVSAAGGLAGGGGGGAPGGGGGGGGG